jgi:flagellar biosynthesis protein
LSDRDRTSPSRGAEKTQPEKQQKAVAIAHEAEGNSVPRVVASGRGAVAEQILQIAFAHGVKVREDADLVEVLSQVDVDSDIPLEAFATVAEILAYVYRANGLLPASDQEFTTNGDNAP